MKKSLLWSNIAVLLTAAMLSTGLTSCSDDDDDEGGKSGAAGVIGAWSYSVPSGGENILVFLAGGQGVNISFPEPESESFAPRATMDLYATTRIKAKGISMGPFTYILSAGNGTSGTIRMHGNVAPFPFEVKGKRLYLTADDGIFEFTRMAGTGNEKDMPVGLWSQESGKVGYVSIPASGMVMFEGFRAYCLPTGSSSGYLYQVNATYPTTYRIKGKEMHMTNPASKYEKVLTLIDTKVLEGSWTGETEKSYYTYTFYPYDLEEEEGRGVAIRTMKNTGNKTEFPFEYVIFDETHGVVILDSDKTEYFYQIEGKKMYVYTDEEMTKLAFELTKE